MKLFHLSDLHIGLKLMNRELKADQMHVMTQVVEYAKEEQPDVIMIAGDIYDKAVPSAEAVELFDWFVSGLCQAASLAEVMMISGNHDSASRINLFRSILESRNVHMIGFPPQTPEEFIEKITLKDEWGKVNFYLLPFVKPSMVKQITGTDENGNNLSYNDTVHRLIGREKIDATERNVLVSHQFYLPAGKRAEEVERMDSEIRTVGNIDEVKADVLEGFDYAALGHIHKPMKVGSDRYRYCGTLLASSVSEAGQKKGVIKIMLGEKGNVETETLPLVPLREVRVVEGTLEEILEQQSDDYVTVILTDRVDFDVFDLHSRLRKRFPNLLEIRRKKVRKADYGTEYDQEEQPDAFELCKAVLGELDEAEEDLLREVIRTVQEVEQG